jgi:VWFA-related protein
MSRPGFLVAAAGLALATAGLAQAPAPQARRGFAVEIREPADGAIVVGPTRLTAEVIADDPTRVAEVSFYVDDNLVFVDRDAPYQAMHDFGTQPLRRVVRVVVRHTAGFTVEKSIVTREMRLSYSVEVHRVVVTVTALDGEGAPITGLTRDDFRLRENGKEQTILEFAQETRPLRIALVLDSSGSMRQSLPQVQAAAAGFLDVLRPEDLAMVVDFDDQVMLLQDLTANRSDLRAAVMSTFARGGTAMYDAVHATLRRLSRQTERKAIVLLSDGGDSASVLDRDRTLQKARSSDVLVYAIGLGKADDSVLKSLARETGGRAFSAGSESDLPLLYVRIADELRNQYVLVYSSTQPEYDGTWREIDLDYLGKGNVTLVARRGYYAVRPAPRPLAPASLTAPPEEEEDGAGAEEAAPPEEGSAAASPPAPPGS